jgi:FkbM family methyltransferase
MFIELTREIAAEIIRRLPSVRGLGRGWRILNHAFLRLGADPLIKVRMNNGTYMIVDLRSSTEVRAYYRGEYDNFEITTLLSLFDLDKVFLDIGANIGFYTVAIASAIRNSGSVGGVMAFEPFKGNYARALENVKINNLSDYCSILNFGLSNEGREGLLILREDFEHGSSTGNAAIATNNEFDKGFSKEKITLKSLDSLLVEYPEPLSKIDIVKMDIEGHEDLCLEGAANTFAKYRPTFLIEVNKPYYEARGVDLDERFVPVIPEDYLIFKFSKSGWSEINSFHSCETVENVFLIPKEKLRQARYNLFM